MNKTLRVLRVLTIGVLSLVVAVPVALYILLSTPWAQNRLCELAENELGALLGTDVSVQSVDVHPFNRFDACGVSVADDEGETCLSVERLSVRFELYHFLRTRRIVFDYALVDRPSLRLWRNSDGAPLNVDGIVRRLRGKEGGNGARFRFKVATLALRDGSVSYDVLDSETAEAGCFDSRHIFVGALQLHASLRLVSNDAFDVEVDRLSFNERSGFSLSSLESLVQNDSTGLYVRDLRLELPNSMIALGGDFHYSDSKWHIATDSAAESVLYLPDIAAFLPPLRDLYVGLDVDLMARGDSATAILENLHMSSRAAGMELVASGGIVEPGGDREHMWLSNLIVKADARRVSEHMRYLIPGSKSNLERLALLGRSDLRATASVTGRREVKILFDARTEAGRVRLDANALSADSFATAMLKTSAQLEELEAGALLRLPKLGRVSAVASAEGRAWRHGFDGLAELDEAELYFNGRKCGGIRASADIERGHVSGRLEMDDRAVQVDIAADASFASGVRSLSVDGKVSRLDLHWLGVLDAYEDYTLSASVNAEIRGRNVDDAAGRVALADVDFRRPDGDGLSMRRFELSRYINSRPAVVELTSDYVNGRIEGAFAPSKIVTECRAIAGAVFPALGLKVPDSLHGEECHNDFGFEFTIADAEDFSRFFRLPVQIIHPIEISGSMDCAARRAGFAIDASYLQQGEKIIDNTAIIASADGNRGEMSLYASTRVPTKKGPMSALLNVGAAENMVSTSADWTIERKIPLNGSLSFAAKLGLGLDGHLAADVDIKPGTVNFGDDVWNILPSRLSWRDGEADIDGFVLKAGEQRIAVNGVVSDAEEPVVYVDIDRVSLLPIFETLEIDKALLSGIATGVFEGRSLMSPSPVLTSERLHVDGIGYNRCTLGDADVRAHWDNAAKAVVLDADLTGPEGRHSSIYGSITPASEELDITFVADRVRVGFMQPFMSAFASKVDGYASGQARLFGTFKYIDLEGDVFADSLALKIDFTNTEYLCSDSVRLRPGLITVRNAEIRDSYGHTARLDGDVRHVFFKQPSFDFRVRDARDFLCYNVGSKESPDWYGTIFGNGGAHISGEPGVVNIDVNMATASGSSFTFVLNDMLDADEYSFITFRDRTPVQVVDSVVGIDAIPPAVLEYQKRMTAQAQDEPSDYNMDFRVDITPAAKIILVMDPVGGDEIKAFGNGNLRLTYGSANNDLRMFGTYTLDRGSYNFTLQDIIIKDFTIDEGSKISFHGDPYAAQLDIEAVYSVNANLSDLDESFLQDRDLNRTNVPVHALMKVTGDMRQPDINFDLRFPTLTSDVYRKVRSIVSTEEMMNRQIIYLLALNRFYTPDYMSTTKGNELFSVASSTISSQLGSMLGKLSENWTIAPNLRSDRGDFSDVEVDVALSSRLLNNRLLFNGNFGYRDKSLNTNQFVGDFDVEYLLNRRGTWRLKAYNRYNDQNYYLRSAATTQGVGIMFKRDFDSLLSWLKPLRRKKDKSRTDSVAAPAALPADSVAEPSVLLEFK